MKTSRAAVRRLHARAQGHLPQGEDLRRHDGVQLNEAHSRGTRMAKSNASSICPCCRNEKEFALPEHLFEKIKNEEVVLFVGAGMSTENKDHCQSTFYEQIQAELGISNHPSFPELMSRYCTLPDGRIKLIERIKQRFDYFKSFSDFYRPMTRFHRAVAPLYMIRDIITTNWDDFFERECLIDAFVHDSDLAFWDASPRRLMKIHDRSQTLDPLLPPLRITKQHSSD